MRVISISENRLNPLIQMGVALKDLTPEGLGESAFHLVVLSDEQFAAMQQLYGNTAQDIEDITPKGLRLRQGGATGYLYSKGGKIPNGLKLRASYLSRVHNADVHDGKIWLNLKPYDNPSSAARSITRNQVNGWDFWEYQDKESGKWHTLSRLRSQ